MRTRQLLLGAVVLGLIAVLAYSAYRAYVGPKLSLTELVHRPECGHTDSVLVDPNFVQSSTIPEYNDCQRFIDSTKTKYDSLYAIFVSAIADTVTSYLGVPLPAVTRVSRSGSSTVLPPGTPGVPVLAAVPMAPTNATAVTIAMVDADGYYPPLGIVPGRNCLYVWYYSVGNVTQWTAKMTAAANELCPQQTVGDLETLPGKVLQVYREEVVDSVTQQPFGRADYPPVARWDWDLKNNEQYVSIVCDVGWCQIGDPGFERSPALPLDGANTAEERRVRLIKGWYDQQYVAKRTMNNTVTPSELVGTIFPEPDLGIWDDPSDFNGWKIVAWIVVNPTTPDAEGTLAQYKTKLGFRKSTFARPLRVRIKHETSGKWRVRVEHRAWYGWPGKENKVKFRNTGANYAVPGTARWRWKDNDEGTWTRCTEGCCEMGG